MSSLRILSRLLEYPDAALWAARDEVVTHCAALTDLPLSARTLLQRFSENWLSQELLDAQAAYLETFEQGRATSLLLFEHTYGESRDRGQAMVELRETYRQAGLQPSSRELPDYLPLYLEYLSTLPDTVVQAQLLSFAPTLSLLLARLQKRGSAYAALFECLLTLAGTSLHSDAVQAVCQEAPDNTPAALDAAWQEAQVSFDATSACPSRASMKGTQTLAPLHFSPSFSNPPSPFSNARP